MRVAGGKAKGLLLKVPRNSSLRPTTELARGALFSILGSMASDWSLVLDLYAGSGALGIEALSRGADWADFVEQNPRCCAIIKENLNRTGFASQAHVYCCSANKALSILDKEYNLILLDPPYSQPFPVAFLEALTTSKLVGMDSIIVVEHSSRYLPLSKVGSSSLIRNRQYGDTSISIYQKEGEIDSSTLPRQL